MSITTPKASIGYQPLKKPDIRQGFTLENAFLTPQENIFRNTQESLNKGFNSYQPSPVGISQVLKSKQFEQQLEEPDQEEYEGQRKKLGKLQALSELGNVIGTLGQFAGNQGYNPPPSSLNAGDLFMNRISALDDDFMRSKERFQNELMEVSRANTGLYNDDVRQDRAQQIANEARDYAEKQRAQELAYRQMAEDEDRDAAQDRFDQEMAFRKKQAAIDNSFKSKALEAKGNTNKNFPYAQYAIDAKKAELIPEIEAADARGDFLTSEILTTELNDYINSKSLGVDAWGKLRDTEGRNIALKQFTTDLINNLDPSDDGALNDAAASYLQKKEEIFGEKPTPDSIKYTKILLKKKAEGRGEPEPNPSAETPFFQAQGGDGTMYDPLNNREEMISSFGDPNIGEKITKEAAEKANKALENKELLNKAFDDVIYGGVMSTGFELPENVLRELADISSPEEKYKKIESYVDDLDLNRFEQINADAALRKIRNSLKRVRSQSK